MLSLLRSSLKSNLTNPSIRYFKSQAQLAVNYQFNGMSPGIVIDYAKRRKEEAGRKHMEDAERKRRENEEKKRKEDEEDDHLLIYTSQPHEQRVISGHGSDDCSSSYNDD